MRILKGETGGPRRDKQGWHSESSVLVEEDEIAVVPSSVTILWRYEIAATKRTALQIITGTSRRVDRTLDWSTPATRKGDV